MPRPPELTPEARAAALEKATRARRTRAEAKEKLKMGAMNLSELLEQAGGEGDEARALASLKVLSAIESMPGLGKVRARRLVEELKISPERRLQGLGRNQRSALLDYFERG
ncbi:MAG: integration host factor [Acidimicrobiia bacterium]|nr:integration host factor [Acidimicrobiia bacterium]